MKKTITAHFSGTVFHIEEDAYDRLQGYLTGIRSRLEGSAEIMADIEARIAELFTERLGGRRQVVTIGDVDHVIATMGQPEDYGDGQGAPAAAPVGSGQRGYKRLFRDPDDKWVGGVIGGLGAYIGTDPLWLRIALIVFILLGWGAPVVLYVLLWILVPKAETPAERLMMSGEPVNVDNLKRAFEEGGRRVAEEARDLGRRWERQAQARSGSAAGVLARIIGLGIVVLAFSLLLSLITSAVGGAFGLWHATWGTDDMGLFDLGGLLFEDRRQGIWLFAGVLLLVLIPIIGLFLAGFRLLLGTRTPAWLGWSLAILWIAALVPAVIGGLGLAREFHRANSSREEIVLQQPSAGTLYLDALMPDSTKGDWSIRYRDGHERWDFEGLVVDGGAIRMDNARLDVERSPDSLFRLVIVREARGRTAKDALAKANAIRTAYEQQGDALLVSPVISYATGHKLRGQEARFTLLVPVGKAVFFRSGSRQVIHDVDNVTHTRDRDMIGKTWRMTPKGLEEGEPGAGQGAHAEPAAARSAKRAPKAPPAPMPPPADAHLPLPEVRLPSLLSLLRLRV